MLKKIIPVLIAAISLLTVMPSRAAEEKRVALTFDDGPHPRQTMKILDYLDKEDIKATFFVIGVNAKQWGDIVREEIERGHEIGNHTYTHDRAKRESAPALKSDLLTNQSLLEEEFGYKTSLFRPPEGVCNENVKSVACDLGYSLILWDIDTKDWAHSSASSIVENVMNNVRDGDVILFHDYVSGENHTLEALKTIVPMLKEEGYTFVTVSELNGKAVNK